MITFRLLVDFVCALTLFVFVGIPFCYYAGAAVAAVIRFFDDPPAPAPLEKKKTEPKITITEIDTFSRRKGK